MWLFLLSQVWALVATEDFASSKIGHNGRARHGRFVSADARLEEERLHIEQSSSTAQAFSEGLTSETDGSSVAAILADGTDSMPDSRDTSSAVSYIQGRCSSFNAKVADLMTSKKGSAVNLSSNVCPYRYYVFDVLATHQAEMWEVAEIKLYYMDRKFGRRTYPASEVVARFVGDDGKDVESCDKKGTPKKSLAFDLDATTTICAPNTKAKLWIDLGKPIVLTLYTIISARGSGSRERDPTDWILWGSADGSMVKDRLYAMSNPSRVSFPTGGWLCDPPWIVEGSDDARKCLTMSTTSTTTTTTTTTTSTTTATVPVVCAYRYYCFHFDSVQDNADADSWALAEIEFRNGVPGKPDAKRVQIKRPPRQSAWFLDGLAKKAASVTDPGTEAFNVLDGNIATFAHTDGTYSNAGRGIALGRLKDSPGRKLASQLCIDFGKAYPATHFVLVSAQAALRPNSWTVKASHTYTDKPSKWVTVSRRSSDENIWPTKPGRVHIFTESLTCPQPQVQPCEAMQCPYKHVNTGAKCAGYSCEDTDQETCCTRK